MGLVELVSLVRRDAKRMSRLAEMVVAQSTEAVWQRVVGQIGALRSHEARGYIRARAEVVVRRASQEVAPRSEFTRERIHERAMEMVVERIVERQRQSMATPTRRARAA